MQIDENDFFRQASRRICGSLDIGKAMMDFIAFAQPYIPISELSLCHFRHDAIMIENLLTITPSGKIRVIPPINPTPELIEFLQRLWVETGKVVKIENNPDQNMIVMAGLPFFETRDPSVMVMHLAMDGINIGGVALFAEGHGSLTQEHAHLFALLREPFSIAMSNALRYQEVFKLKDMLDVENRELSQELRRYCGDIIIGADNGLAGVMDMVRQVAPLSNPVMLLGETGVGKELIANEIYRLSARNEGPFIKVNCGAIPESLVDAELFGHEKGAFTGAVSQKRGRFERAHQGTIFLDEIGELPLQAQVRLLRVLQNKEIERVGGTQTIRVDVRIISATNKNLEAMVREGKFREDLWYRLNIFPITIPPLRQHAEDIPALVHHFVAKKARELKIHTTPQIPPSAMEKLKNYAWPGNVRELENMIERILIRSRGKDGNALLEVERLHQSGEVRPERRHSQGGYVPLTLEEAMTRHILGALRQTGGKIYGPDGAAALLGVFPETLRSRMRKYGIRYQKTGG